MKLQNVRKLSPLCLAIITALSANAYAENAAPAAKERKIEVIEVTAQKRSQSINDVPMSISAIGGDTLAEQGISDISNLETVVPGFVASDSILGTPIYTLRGIGFNEDSAQSTSTVGIYVDEIAIPFPIMSGGLMLDIERIEVLKGPQGTLFGRNSTAGAINMLATRPTEDLSYDIKAGYDNFSAFDFEGAVSNSLSDSVRARAAIRSVTSNKGWQESVSSNRKLGEQDKFAARLTVEADITDNTLATVTANYWSDKSDTLAPQAVARTFSKTSATNIIDLMNSQLPVGTFESGDNNKDADWTLGSKPQRDSTSKSISLTIQHEFSNGMSLKLLSNISNFEENSEFNRDGIAGLEKNAETNAFVPYDTDYDNYADSSSLFDADIDTSSHELHFSGASDSVAWVAGVYYSKTDVSSNDMQVIDLTTNSNGGAVNFGSVHNDTHQETETKAIFASADWTLSDDMVLTTGIRYSKNTADFDGCTRDTDGNVASYFTKNHGFGLAGLNGLDDPDGPYGPYAPYSIYAKLLAPADEGACITAISYDDYTGPVNGTVFPAAIGVSGRFNDTLEEDSTSFRTALNYNFNDDVSGYVSYSRGFKAGSYPTLAASVASQYTPAVQEQLDDYEIGIKATLDEGAAQVNAAIFYYDYTDKQLKTKLPVAPFGTLFTLDNADSASVKGAEIDFTWMATDNLILSGGATYMTTEIDDFVGYTQLGVEADFSGSAFPFSPNLSATLSANYELELSDDYLLQVGIDVTYQGDRNSDYEYSADDVISGADNEALYDLRKPYDSEFELPSYTLVNARIGIADMNGEWRVYAWGRNLTDKFYTNNSVNSLDYLVRYAGHARTFGINAEYLF